MIVFIILYYVFHSKATALSWVKLDFLYLGLYDYHPWLKALEDEAELPNCMDTLNIPGVSDYTEPHRITT